MTETENEKQTEKAEMKRIPVTLPGFIGPLLDELLEKGLWKNRADVLVDGVRGLAKQYLKEKTETAKVC